MNEANTMEDILGPPDAELGRRIARENAVREMWPLMGYALRERLHSFAQNGEG